MKKIIHLFATLILGLLLSAPAFSQQRPVDLVYNQLDAANSRWFFFSSACRPFGMVSLFPDNKIDGEWESGYRYNVDTIQCFSHIHEWQLSGVAVMPVAFTKEKLKDILTNYASAFSHQKEIIHPGYHRVYLNRYHITAELTATNRVGVHRYQFPSEKQSGILFQLGGHLGPSDLLKGGFEQISDHEISGFMVNGPTIRRAKECPVFFNAVFDHPIKKIYLLQEGTIIENPKKWNGKDGKLLVEFDNPKQVIMKVGISYTDEKGAVKNRETEMKDWDFDGVTKAAASQWNNMLSRITIEGGTLTMRKRFYTDLWHSIQGRRIISDADGKYSDFTTEQRLIKQIPINTNGKPKFNMYNSDAFWGAQWTINTLWQLVYPEIAEEFCNSFLEYYKNGGLIPRGPSGGNYTYVMTGASSTPFYVSAWQKGIRGFDIAAAYEGLRKNHLPGGMMGKAGYEHTTTSGGGINYYIDKGYVPYPLPDKSTGMHKDGAGMTMEYAYQDWTLAQLAKSIGKTDDYKYFMKRSGNWKNIFNTATGYIEPKDKDGNWRANYDPLEYDHGFIEGNGAQYSWLVPQDMAGLFSLLGGKDSAVKKLNWQFEQTRQYDFCNEHPEFITQKTAGNSIKMLYGKFINDKKTWINYSNQPNMQSAFIFNYAGAPWLTQYWSRQVVDSAYSGLTPYRGYNGDEDQGLMGTQSVLMKIGIYQMSGGCDEDPRYEIGSPIFSKITIHLNRRYYTADQFVIEAKNQSPKNSYIKSAAVNNKLLQKFYFRHSDINKGVTIKLVMDKLPNKNWGIE